MKSASPSSPHSASRRFVSVGTKLASASLVLVLLVTSAVYIALSRYERENLLHAKELSANAVTRLFAATAASAVVFNDDTAIAEQLATLGGGEEIEVATIWAVHEGAVGSTLGRWGQGKAPPARASVPTGLTLDRERDRVVVWSPIVNRDSAVVGMTAVVFSLARENAAIAAVGWRTLLVSASVALGLVALLFWISRRAIVKPLDELVGVAKRLERGDRVEVVLRSNDEIGQLASAFRSMTEAIQSREQLIRARNEDMRLVLDNVEQGFVTLDQRGIMAEECSRIVGSWFGDTPPNTTFWAFLAPLDANTAQMFELGWEMLTEGMMPLDVCIAQLPRHVDKGEVALELTYRPVMNGETLSKLIVVITDVTARQARARAEQAQRELTAIFQRILADRLAFEEFFAEADALVTAIEGSDGSDEALLKRQIHTLKGNAGLFGMESLPLFCHELEEQLEESGPALGPAARQALRAHWTKVAELRAQLGEGHRIEIEHEEYDAFLDAMRSRGADVALQAAVEAWAFEPAARRLELLGEQTRRLAMRLGRAPVVTTFDPTSLRLPPRTWGPLWAALAHVVRNVVDHGIETVDDRADSGKSAQAKVDYSLEETGSSLVLRVTDDGRGIDWARVAEKARARGLSATTQQDLDEALFADGLSTAHEASVTSGRGVGLSAVRAVVRELGGEITVSSVRGQGTQLRFVLPRSMLIDSAPAVRSAGGAKRRNAEPGVDARGDAAPIGDGPDDERLAS